MNLFNEITKSLGFNEYAPASFCFSVVGGYGGYFENVKKIVDIKRSCVTIKCGSVEIDVFGENLSVASFSGGDLSLKGKITKIEVK